MKLIDQLVRAQLLGVNIALVDYELLLECVHSALNRHEPVRINFCNVHVTMLAQHRPALLAALNHPQALTVPDGMPLVWALRSLGYPLHDRVYGPDFFELCLSSQRGSVKHYFFGSSESTLQKLRATIEYRFPGLLVAGMYSPPFRPLSPAEEAGCVKRINAADADILWIGLGAPKQELWIKRNADKLNVPVVAAVGAGFDFLAGTIRQAPAWMQRAGLEWLFRLLMEPRRLWFRYLYYNPLFIVTFVWVRYIRRHH